MKDEDRSVTLKKHLLRYIFVLLLLTLTGLFYFAATPPAFLVDGMTVTHTATEESLFYPLDHRQASSLLHDMSGEPRDRMPPDLDPTYDITLHLKGVAERHYSLSSTTDLSLYIKKASQIYRLAEVLEFFYSHPAFSRIYPYAVPPEASLTGLDEAAALSYSEIAWEYQQQNSTWVTHDPSSSETFSPQDYPLSNPDTSLFLNIDPVPDTIRLQITDPAGSVRYDDVLDSQELPLFPFNGRHEYHLTLNWEDSHQPYRGTASTHFGIEMDFPLTFEPPGPVALQGEMLTFRFRHVPEDAELVLQENVTGGDLPLYPMEDGYVAYLPTHYGNTPGEYKLSYGLQGEPLTESTLTLLPRNFQIQYLTIDPSVAAATRNEEAAAMSARYFTPSRNISAPERYYTEDFVIPVSGRLTTEFGETRYVNNAPTSYRHSGLDIAAATGTPVVAVNRGRVVLAMELITQGNTVVIDHGQGLFSVYFHMDELSTAADRIVERGETIGTVGTTGFSTGPHLHFTMSYYRHNLEPGHFLVGEPITYQNAVDHLAP